MRKLVAIIIVLLILICWQNSWLYGETLLGLWSASSKFCDKAGVDAIYLYINHDKSYMLIKSGESIVSSLIDLRYYTLPSPLLTTTPSFYASADIENESLKSVLAEKFYIDLNLHKNKMKMYDDDVVYASMKKI